jgi:hypothetical protein
VNFPPLLLLSHSSPEWMAALDENAPAIAMASCVVLVLAVIAGTFLFMRRRDMDALQQTDESFVSALQGAPHLLSIYQDQQPFHGSPRWQIYLAACRELCFYLIGTDQVEKNFPTRLRAAGRIMPSQMTAVVRAMRLAAGECALALRTLSPNAFFGGLALPLVGLLGSLAVFLSIALRKPASDLDAVHLLMPASIPFLLSVFALLLLLPLSLGLANRLSAHAARLHLFPLSLANLMERVFVDHRQSMEELPSVAGLGAPHVPSLSLPPAEQARRSAV